VVLVLIDDATAVPRGFGADAIHGYVHRGNDGDLAELVQDTLAALRDSGAGSQPDAESPRVGAT